MSKRTKDLDELKQKFRSIINNYSITMFADKEIVEAMILFDSFITEKKVAKKKIK